MITNKQRGSAILMALMFMAMAATLSVAISFKQSVATRRSQLITDINRMQQAETAALSWAEDKLTYDKNEQDHFDALDQEWTEPMPTFKQEGLTLDAKLVDGNRFLNLNAFYQGLHALDQSVDERRGESGSESTSEEDRDRQETAGGQEESGGDREQWLLAFYRLLQRLASQNNASFIQPDEQARDLLLWFQGGEEENNPERLWPALPMVSPSELRLLPNMDAQSYQKLLPYVIALPFDPDSPPSLLNINTCSAEVLAALLDKSVDEAKSLLDARPFRTRKSVQQSLSASLSDEGDSERDPSSVLGIQSNYFILESVATLGKEQLSSYYLLHRLKPDKLELVWLSRGSV